MTSDQGLPLPQRYWAILVVALAVIDGAIANIALPTIALNLKAAPVDSVWVVNAYQLVITMSLLAFASIGDRIGYRRVYIAGLALFTASSFACALSGSLGVLIAALIREIYPQKQLGRGISANATVVTISSVIGPTVVSGMLSIAPWPWLFAVNVPIGIVAVDIGLKALPRSAGHDQPFDIVSALMNALFFAPVDRRHRWTRARRTSALCDRRVCCGARGRVLFRAAAVAAESAFAVDRSVTHSGVRLVDRHVHLFLLRADAGVRFAAVPAAKHLHNAGRNRFPDDAVAIGHRGRCAARGHPRGPLSAGFARRYRAGGSKRRACVAGDHRRTSGRGRYRVAHGRVRHRFRHLPDAEQPAMLSAAPRHRSGGASGMLGTVRFTGQTLGATLVALIFGIAPQHGAVIALYVAAGFALAASVVSMLRLASKRRVETA